MLTGRAKGANLHRRFVDGAYLFKEVLKCSSVGDLASLRSVGRYLGHFFRQDSSIVAVDVGSVRVLRSYAARALVGAYRRVFAKAIATVESYPRFVSNFKESGRFVTVPLGILS